MRFNGEAAWRLQDTGTTILFGGTVSRGLDALGARMPGDPNDPGFLPLSRAGASPVFTKVNGHFELTQTGPADVFLSLLAFGQSSFRQPLLVSEQFDITGPKMLSGFPIGALFGDTA